MKQLPIYIFDLDGTLALTNHRQHLLYGEKRMWKEFFELCHLDKPNQPVIQLLQQLHLVADVRIFSGRSDAVLRKTIDWLVTHTRLPESALPPMKMRRSDDFTADDELKRQWYDELTMDEKSRLVCIFDDRDRVVAMWRAIGVTCLQVAPGDF